MPSIKQNLPNLIRIFYILPSCKQTPCSAEFVARTPFIYY